MREDNDKYKMLYIEKEKCIYSILLSILLYIFIYIFFNKIPDVKNTIMGISYLIGSCTIILLSQTILNIHSKYNHIFVSYIYICIGVFAFNLMIPIELINSELIKVLRYKNFFNTIYIAMTGVFIDCVSAYVLDNSYKSRKWRDISIISISFIINYAALLFHIPKVLLIFNYLVFILLTFNIHKFQKVKFKDGNKINVIVLLLYMSEGISVINIMNLMSSNMKTYFLDLNEMIVFVSYILFTVLIIDKLINRTYRVLFSDIYKENLEMDLLNSKVVKKNRELDFSQAVIRKREKMFKMFFLSIPVPLVLISKNGRIIFANLSFQKLIEEDNIKNIINKKIFNIININGNADLDDLVSTGTNNINAAVKCKSEDKSLDIELIDLSHNSTEVIMILNDVTSRVKVGKMKMEMENNKFQEKIKSDFLSNISHDLKTPVNVIYSAAQLIPVFINNNNKEALKKYNMICKMNCFGLIRLTNNLIDSSRIYSDYLSANLQVENIVEIVEEIVMSLVDYAKSKNIRLVFDTDEEEIYVKIDEEFMQRIIVNVVSNAIKFSNEDGKIEVSIHNSEEEVLISVKDNGIGMEQQFIEKAFNRYAMGKNKDTCSEKGTGIGLFVVKKLVEKQNGQISIESEVNKGTNVRMKFYKEI